MTKQEIDSLFQNESYDLATIKLRNALREDSSNAEWFYYLYLAENRDYANIDFDNVHNEMDLNHAIDLSNKRLRDFFDSEYSFYKAVDPYLRKFFTYASRENYKSFSSCLDSYSFKPTKLIHNYTDKNDFFSNLDYLVTIRIKPEIVYLNLLALNILYIVTKEEDVLSVWNTLKEKAKDANMESSELKLFHTKEEIKESLHSYLNKKDNNKNKVVIEERKPEPKKEESKGEVEESLREGIFDNNKGAAKKTGGAVKNAFASTNARLANVFEGFYVETKYEDADPEYRNYVTYEQAKQAAIASSCLGNATQAKVLAKSKANGQATLIDGYVEGKQAGKGKIALKSALKAADGTAREGIFYKIKDAAKKGGGAFKIGLMSFNARLAKGFEGFYIEIKYENADPEYRYYASYMKARDAAIASSLVLEATQAKVFAKSKANGQDILIDGYVKGKQAGKGKTAFERALKAADGTAAIKNTAEHQAARLDLDNDNAPAFQAATAQEPATDTAKPAAPTKKPEPAGPIKREDVKGKVNSLSGNQNSPSYIELFGIKITVFSIVLFVLSVILLVINVTNDGQSVIFSLIGITMFIKLVTLIGAIDGVNCEDRRVNGSIPVLIICSIGIVVDIIGVIVTTGM